MKVTIEEIQIKNGEVIVHDTIIGYVFKFFKHGYHPMARLEVKGPDGDRNEAIEYEIDTKGLMDVIKDDIQDMLESM